MSVDFPTWRGPSRRMLFVDFLSLEYRVLLSMWAIFNENDLKSSRIWAHLGRLPK